MGREVDEKAEAKLDYSDDEEDNDASEDIDDPDVDDTDVESRKKYKCTEPGCTARFLRPSRLTWHLRKHNDERPYKCDHEGCDRAYTNSSHLKRHQNTSHKTKVITTLYRCKECNLEVGSLYSLNRHCRKIHNAERLTCNQCGVQFRKKHCYTEHLAMHAGIAMYNCKVCDREYTTQRLLRRHERTHDKTKTYACKSPDCNEIFEKWSLLMKHVETTHQFDHKCKECDKKFKMKCNLVRHETAHKSNINYVICPYEDCPRFYSHERNLDEHIDSFHFGRKYYCDNCGESYAWKSTIARHIKVVHGSPQPLKKRKKPRKRKDAGSIKKSMASKLAGLELPYELEKRVLHRKPRIQLDENTENVVNLKRKNETCDNDDLTETEIASEKHVLQSKRKKNMKSIAKNRVTRKKKNKLSPNDDVEQSETEMTLEKRLSRLKRKNISHSVRKSPKTRKGKNKSSEKHVSQEKRNKDLKNVQKNQVTPNKGSNLSSNVNAVENEMENAGMSENAEKQIPSLGQIEDLTVMKNNVESRSDNTEKKSAMDIPENVKLNKETEIMLEKSLDLPKQIEKEKSRSAGHPLQEKKLIASENGIEKSFDISEQEEKEILDLEKALLNKNMGNILDSFLEKSYNLNKEINADTLHHEVDVTDGSNANVNDVSDQMDFEISLLAAKALRKENLTAFENSSKNSPDLIDQRISPFLFMEISSAVTGESVDERS